MTPDALISIASALLPGVSACLPGGREYNPAHCMAVYHPPPRDELALELPAIMVGENAAHFGQACTLLEGIPASPPSGCIVLGTWEDLEATAPQLLQGLERANGPEAYVIRFDRYALIVANTRDGVLHGAQTFVQILAARGEERVPGLTVYDDPVHRYRSLAYDLRTHEFRPEHIVRVIALLGSFKGNRLHLFFDPSQPLAHRPRIGSVVYDDALTAGQSCLEYGITPVPWADLVARVVRGAITPGAACEMALDLANAFDTDALGLGWDPLPTGSDVHAARGFLRAVLSRYAEPPQIYLEANLLAALYADVDIPDGLRAVVCTVDVADGCLADLAAQDVPLAVLTTSATQGFLQADITQTHAAIDAHLEMAAGIGAAEVGFACMDLKAGHLWEHDLTSWVVCVARGWGGVESAAVGAQRFADLAFGDEGEAYLQTLETVAATFAGMSPGTGTADILDLAFGAPAPASAWQRLAALNWRSLETRLTAAERAVRDCRNRVQRNSGILDHVDLGLTAMRFLVSLNTLLRQAHDHYCAAREGRAGSLTLAHTALENLLAYVPVFVARLQGIKVETGACGPELDTLVRFQEHMEAMCKTLAEAQAGASLPAATDVGFPPLVAAPGTPG